MRKTPWRPVGVPEDLCKRLEVYAQSLGMPFSRFCVQSLQEIADYCDNENEARRPLICQLVDTARRREREVPELPGPRPARTQRAKPDPEFDAIVAQQFAARPTAKKASVPAQ